MMAAIHRSINEEKRKQETVTCWVTVAALVAMWQEVRVASPESHHRAQSPGSHYIVGGANTAVDDLSSSLNSSCPTTARKATRVIGLYMGAWKITLFLKHISQYQCQYIQILPTCIYIHIYADQSVCFSTVPIMMLLYDGVNLRGSVIEMVTETSIGLLGSAKRAMTSAWNSNKWVKIDEKKWWERWIKSKGWSNGKNDISSFNDEQQQCNVNAKLYTYNLYILLIHVIYYINMCKVRVVLCLRGSVTRERREWSTLPRCLPFTGRSGVPRFSWSISYMRWLTFTFASYRKNSDAE